jgi:hypothetical protein
MCSLRERWVSKKSQRKNGAVSISDLSVEVQYESRNRNRRNFLQSQNLKALRARYGRHVGINVQIWIGVAFAWEDATGKPPLELRSGPSARKVATVCAERSVVHDWLSC